MSSCMNAHSSLFRCSPASQLLTIQQSIPLTRPHEPRRCCCDSTCAAPAMAASFPAGDAAAAAAPAPAPAFEGVPATTADQHNDAQTHTIHACDEGACEQASQEASEHGKLHKSGLGMEISTHQQRRRRRRRPERAAPRPRAAGARARRPDCTQVRHRGASKGELGKDEAEPACDPNAGSRFTGWHRGRAVDRDCRHGSGWGFMQPCALT